MKRPTNSVSPCEKVGDTNGDGDNAVEDPRGGNMNEDSDEEDLGMDMGEACEKVRVEKEGAVVKKLLDPKLPTQAVVDDHWVRGHVEYRNWCEVCVKARGKEWDHTRATDKERLVPEYAWDYCSLGMRWGTNGRFWWGRKGRPRGGWR